MKFRVLIILGIAIVVVSLTGMLSSPDKAKARQDHMNLVMRSIGHHLLLAAGDSSSRVLPVVVLSEDIYSIGFEKPFSFLPDSLVSITRTELRKNKIESGFTASVLDCKTQSMIYGFEIHRAPMIGREVNDDIACLGREQPRGCYQVQISLTHSDRSGTNVFFGIALMGLFVVAFVGGTYYRRGSKQKASSSNEAIMIGVYEFYSSARCLKNDREQIELSEKETALLEILAAAKNELVTRDELLKRVWEDQGVFTGRSLDMFISKLRKKLKNDPSLQIVNVHGRGYKLETP